MAKTVAERQCKLPTSIIARVLAIGVIAGAVLIAGNFFAISNDRSSKYSDAVRTLESAQKIFALGEVFRLGAYDVTAAADVAYSVRTGHFRGVGAQSCGDTYAFGGGPVCGQCHGPPFTGRCARHNRRR